MMFVCRYHKGMKKARSSLILFSLVCCFLVCITDSFAQTSDTASAEIADGSQRSEAEQPAALFTEQTRNAQQPIRLFSLKQIPDSAEIRRNIIDAWLSAPIEQVINREDTTYTDSKGNSFTVSGRYAEDPAHSYAISIIPVLSNYGDSNRSIVPQGMWTVYRNSETGYPVLMTVYPRENPALSIRIRPASEKAHTGKSFADVCLFNAYVRKDISIGLPFEMLYGLTLSELKSMTEAIIPWTLFDPPSFYSSVEAMSNVVRSRSYKLVSLADACFDQNGKPVHISDQRPQTEQEITGALAVNQVRSEITGGVDSAGFAKWIIDGMIRPVAGQGTIIESLKRPTAVPETHFTQPYLKTLDVFSGLHWIRNLGAAALTLNLSRTVYPDASGVDVTHCPFALTTAVPQKNSSGKLKKQPAFSGYERYAGYQTAYLIPLLYSLAITEPGHFYLGCINKEAGDRSLRYYDKIAAFFPYFDMWGAFHVDVYESGEEYEISDFIEKYKDSYTALVRVRTAEIGRFNP